MSILLKNGQIVTGNVKQEVFRGDLLIEGEIIAAMGENLSPSTPHCEVVDVSDQFVIPGLIQTHTHLCQALFRGYADDMSLLSWLEERIWPMEKAHTESSIQASARIALLEMQLMGTTSILDMGTVHHTQSLLEEVEKSGMRYWGGKCLMDLKETSGPLYEERKSALAETRELVAEWNGRSPLMNYAVCPRFAVSCTDEMLKASYEIAVADDLLYHTHASENVDEVQMIKDRSGHDNVAFFDQLGLLSSRTVIVHGVHLKEKEVARMVETKTPLVHCPSANLKLASGLAPITQYRRAGLTIGVGADGAPCNNTMDPFVEMRLAALLQKPQFGPEAWTAKEAFAMATIEGAKLLGVEDQIGSLEVGKLADVVTVSRSHPSVGTVENPYSALVYSCSGRDVENVFINGRGIVREGKHELLSPPEVIARGKEELANLFRRL